MGATGAAAGSAPMFSSRVGTPASVARSDDVMPFDARGDDGAVVEEVEDDDV